ncbi:MAG: hypothetical protein ACJAT4_001662 [Granulosicoccus sp.]|jgi:hypothetical protein
MVNNRLIKVIWQNQMSYLKSGENFSVIFSRGNYNGEIIMGEKNNVGDVFIAAKNMPIFFWPNEYVFY